MRCLKDYNYILYIHNDLPAKEKAKIDLHLAGCRSCAARLQEIRNNREFILKEMDYFEPETIPGLYFSPPVELPKRGKLFNRLHSLSYSRFLKPVLTAAILLILLTAAWLLLFSPLQEEPAQIIYFDTFLAQNGHKALPGAETTGQVIIHSIKINEKPIKPDILVDKTRKTTLIWLGEKF